MRNDGKKDNRTERKDEEKMQVQYTESRKDTNSPFVSSEENAKAVQPLTCWCMIDFEGMLIRGGRRTAREHGLESLVVPLLSHSICLLSSSRHL